LTPSFLLHRPDRVHAPAFHESRGCRRLLCAEAMMARVKVVFAGGLRAENLDHSTTRNSSHAERNVEAQRARRNGFHLVGGARIAQAPSRSPFAQTVFSIWLSAASREHFFTIFFHRECPRQNVALLFSYSAPAAHLIMRRIRRVFLSFFSAIQ